ncbi:glycoside hydrolase family 88 protein [Phycisphaerales bacterium AB-hyl4]|uniref:Glycoside hydrolase family 88 protein n=1 Tax=Natronomicrosphaera hydrolytica TaxID=3242702 RepID=A0ABV4U3X5_9BACT
MTSTPDLSSTLHARYLRPELVHAPSVAMDPPQRRIPFGWGAFAVRPDELGDPARLAWPTTASLHCPARLRVTIASDDREPKQLRFALAGSNRTLGKLDIRYGVVLQPFELPLAATDVDAAIEQGITLSLTEGTTPLWLFYDPEPCGRGHEALLPHLLPETEPHANPLDAFYDCFTSLASLQQFGWMQGCVFDGLDDLANHSSDPTIARHARETLLTQLAMFFPGDRMVYENPQGLASDKPFHNVEATLVVVALARHRPEHPAIEDALRFWREHAGDDDLVGAGHATAEGSLTVGYPLSVLARLRQDRELARFAVAQLLGRQRRLRVGEDLYLRHTLETNTHTYRNWARGAAWHMLGITRSIIELKDWSPPGSLDKLIAEARSLYRWAIDHQRDDGVWNCYLHDPETQAETSGSAGIAAALALAHRHGFAPDDALPAAQRAFVQLQQYLTPDGLLTGVSQSNKKEGGEALQRSGYRTISQTGMGLFAQLAAAL